MYRMNQRRMVLLYHWHNARYTGYVVAILELIDVQSLQLCEGRWAALLVSVAAAM